MSREEKIEYFVPALALEHLSNPDSFTLHQKLKYAILRYFLTKDYYSLISVPNPLPGVFIEHYTFNKEKLGYDVSAIIKC